MNHLSNAIEPATRAFLEALNAKSGPQIYELSIPDARAVLDDAQAGDVAKSAAEIKDKTIPGGPNGQVSIRIVRPKGVSGRLPVVLYFHGGGWVLGNKETHDRLIREIASGAQAAVVFVNFTPAPEGRYPVQIEEAYAATKWVAENSASINADSSRLAVAGDSVGGNMAAAVITRQGQSGSGTYIRVKPAVKWSWGIEEATCKDGKPVIQKTKLRMEGG